MCTEVIHAPLQISKGLGYPISALCLDRAFGSPVPGLCQLLGHGDASGPWLPCADICGHPATDRCKGLTTGGPCVHTAAGGMWGGDSSQLFQLQQIIAVRFPS